MGERKGQNKYYPPDYDPKKGGLNKFRGTHALRERARKIHLGIIIIRFEMPYNIWCEGCNNHIGMGVRYNAEKTKVGMYFSTPIYKFHMKCHLCDNYFDIQTDPGNLDYVILSGARRQENRWDPLQNEQVVPETKEVQKRLFDDPMYKLEHEAKDIKAGNDAKPVLEKLVERNKSVWDDCYEANSRLRAEFRNTKVELKAQSEVDNKLLAKSSLDIALLPETAEDKQMASLMQLHSKSAKERSSEKRLDILMQPTLPGATKTTFGGTKRQKILSTQLQFADLGIKKRQPSDTIVVEEPTSSDETQPRPVCIEKKPVGSEQIDTITSTTSPPSAAPFIRLIVVSPSNPQHDKSSSVVLSVEAAEKLARMTAALKVPSSALARANRAAHHAPVARAVARAAARAPARAAVQAAPDAPVDLSLKATRSFAKVQAAPPVTEASVAAVPVPAASNISVAKVLTLPKSLALVCDYSSSNSDDDSD